MTDHDNAPPPKMPSRLIDAIDSPTVAALAAIFDPRNQQNAITKSYSQQIVEVLAPRLCIPAAGRARDPQLAALRPDLAAHSPAASEEQLANLKYEAGMYQSLYENARAQVETMRAALDEISDLGADGTQAMRDRLRELSKPHQDDYDRAVICALDDLEALLRPCGECHLQPSERCNICGRTSLPTIGAR